jgi:hypothetical protein
MNVESLEARRISTPPDRPEVGPCLLISVNEFGKQSIWYNRIREFQTQHVSENHLKTINDKKALGFRPRAFVLSGGVAV